MSLFQTNKANIDEVFHNLDKNNDGKVNLDELLEVIRTLKIPHSLDGVTSFLRSHKYLYNNSASSLPGSVNFSLPESALPSTKNVSSSSLPSSPSSPKSSPPSSPLLSSSVYSSEALYPVEVVHEFIHLQERRFREAFYELSSSQQQSQQQPNNSPSSGLLRTTDIERFSSRIGVHLSRDDVLLIRNHLSTVHQSRYNLYQQQQNQHYPSQQSTVSPSPYPLILLTIEDLRDLFTHQQINAEGTFQTWLRTAVGPSSLALPDEPTNETPTSILLLSGAVAGILSRSFTAPFDRIKTILQASTIPTNTIVSGISTSSSVSLPSIPNSFVTASLPNSNSSFSMMKFFPNKITVPMPLLDIPNSRMYSATSSSIGFPSYSLAYTPSSASSVAPTFSATRSVQQIVRSIYSEGGLLSFWRGNGMNVLKVAPETAARMFVYERMKTIVAEDPDEPTLFERFTAGATAGVVAQTIIYPAELIKTRLALSSPGQYRSIAHCARNIVQNEGPRALYRGMFASVIGIIPYAGTDLTVYTFLKESWEERNPNKEPSVFTLLQCGALATISGQIISYPLQLIRTRLQAQGMNIMNRNNNNNNSLPGPKYTGIWNCLSQTVKYEGIRGLYRGISVNLMKSVPAMAISYTAFEITKRGLLDWIR